MRELAFELFMMMIKFQEGAWSSGNEINLLMLHHSIEVHRLRSIEIDTFFMHNLELACRLYLSCPEILVECTQYSILNMCSLCLDISRRYTTTYKHIRRHS